MVVGGFGLFRLLVCTIGLTKNISRNDRVCFWHFVSGIAAKPWDRFNINWVPTLNLDHKKQGKNVQAVGNREVRTSQRRKCVEERLEGEVRKSQESKMNPEKPS